MIVTREFLRQRHACYYDKDNGEDTVNGLVPAEGLTPLQVAHLAIPAEDRVWVLTCASVLPDAILWEWAARTVERELGRVVNPDPHSLAVVRLLRRLASGETVPQDELAAFWEASWAAPRAAPSAAPRAAAWATVLAAASAARWAAASAASSAAERQQQIADIINLLEKA
jgi:hypothetical protein